MAPKLGSGQRFSKLSGTLAARGAKDPDALAAWIGRRKYGAARMGRLSHGSEHSSVMLSGSQLQCPSCGYRSDDADFRISGGTAGTSDKAAPDALRTPANAGLQSATGYSPSSAGMNVRSGPGGAGLSQPLDFSRRMPVQTAADIVVSRGSDGRAVIRHRRGGDKIGEIWRTDDGQWKSSLEGGGELPGRTHQRASLQDLVGNWNKISAARPASALQTAPQQTPLMAKYGIPAVAALATPADGAGDGPRATASDDGDENGLTAKGKSVYAKLRAKGWPADRAIKFAKRAQSMGADSFQKAS